MDERIKDILSFEDRLLKDRKMLQDLINAIDTEDSLLAKSKLEQFKSEIKYMENQIEHIEDMYCGAEKEKKININGTIWTS